MADLTLGEIVIRLILSTAFGGVVGFERQYKTDHRDANAHFSVYWCDYYCAHTK